MPNSELLKKSLRDGKFNDIFGELYPGDDRCADRYCDAVDSFTEIYRDGVPLRLFSAPGRTEIGGNHTDHQHGCVLAAGVDLDIIAVAAKTDDNVIRLKSAGFKEDVISLDNLQPVKSETEHAASLIRGVAARLKQLGYNIGGFCAYTTSGVLKGSGLSSSAAFEVLVCTILNYLYNDGQIDAVQTAQIAQYAENNYFGKPCGLMDQTACSCGGFVAIDFAEPSSPVIEKIDFDFIRAGHSLCIVDTGGCHADLTDDYAAVPAEMKSIAEFFGKSVLREVDEPQFYDNIAVLREKVSDRALLRAIHFFGDNRRAVAQREALKKNDFNAFLNLVRESGLSSLAYLQNIFASGSPNEQGLTLALALTERLLHGQGAFRVHGGGFAGTIQAYVPADMLDEYKSQMEKVFGEGKCYVLSVRPIGGTEIKPDFD